MIARTAKHEVAKILERIAAKLGVDVSEHVYELASELQLAQRDLTQPHMTVTTVERGATINEVAVFFLQGMKRIKERLMIFLKS